LDYITPIRFGIGDADKGATECEGSMSDQLTVFPEELLSWCVKVDTLGRLCDDNLKRSYNPFTTTNIYFIGAAYNSYFSNYL